MSHKRPLGLRDHLHSCDDGIVTPPVHKGVLFMKDKYLYVYLEFGMTSPLTLLASVGVSPQPMVG